MLYVMWLIILSMEALLLLLCLNDLFLVTQAGWPFMCLHYSQEHQLISTQVQEVDRQYKGAGKSHKTISTTEEHWRTMVRMAQLQGERHRSSTHLEFAHQTTGDTKVELCGSNDNPVSRMLSHHWWTSESSEALDHAAGQDFVCCAWCHGIFS